ncbi:MAG TPA: type I 3-dehydroquinate dehydratase, partial [Thermoplasmata archaeon]|nr:type I 3-dehydroquinate dehydratase [Thermoplasmata archaeon]
MTDPLRLAVTLPARSLHEAKGEVQVARAAGADFAEIRFDRWPPREWPDAVGLFPTPLPLIATLRSGTEGGEGPDDPVERARWFSIVGELPFAFLDVELARDLADVPHHSSTTVLSSCHLSPGASIAEIGHLAERADRVGSWRKLVVPASVGTFLRDILPNLPRWLDPRTIVLTTGPSGSLARIWARELGEPMVFAALPLAAPSAAPVEPTQVPVDQLARMRSGGRGRRFAVVGAPVGHSLSPAVHGLWLARQQRAASYVALPLDGEAEVRAMLSLGRRGWWDGWSVTHPWKTRLAQEADVRSEAVARTGAASALVFRDGQARAEQTDAEAVRRR